MIVSWQSPTFIYAYWICDDGTHRITAPRWAYALRPNPPKSANDSKRVYVVRP